MPKMNLQDFMNSLTGGDLKLQSFQRNANGRLTKATDESGNEHVFSTSNLRKAIESGVATENDDGYLVIPEANHSMAESGLTLVNYGGGLDLSKEKFD